MRQKGPVMTAKATIINEIIVRAGSSYTAWRIGITNDLAERKTYWKETKKQNVNSWTEWTADSLADARAIEDHFINEKKMRGGVGGDLASSPVYVYIF